MAFVYSPLLVCGLLVTVFLTAILSGILGMAGGMVLMGVLVWLLPVPQAMILHSTAQFFSNGSRAFFHRQHIYWRGFGLYAAGLALSLALFSMIALVPDKRIVFTILGVMPFVQFGIQKWFKFDFTKDRQAFACGAIVTMLHLMGGVSGALLDIFFQKISLTRHQVVATKAATQTLSHIMRFCYFNLILHTAENSIDSAPPLLLMAAVIPAALAGSMAAKYVLDRLSDRHFYNATQALLIVIGAVYLFKAASLWLAFSPP